MRVCANIDGNTWMVARFSCAKIALDWCENVVHAICGKSIMVELNTIQTEVDTKKNPSFTFKHEIPLVILNLVLKQYNLELVPENSDKDGEEDDDV